MNEQDEIFKGKTLNGLFEDIYKKSQEKDRQIKMLIGELRPLIQNIGDATVIVPLIKEYMEVAVKNDDHLIKMSGIIQRLISSSQRTAAVGGDNSLLSEAEKMQLLSELDELEAEVENNTSDSDVSSQIEDVKNKLNKGKQDNEEEQ